MDLYSGHINKLIDELAALPGIGNKSAQRLAFHMIHMPKEKVERLARTMVEAKEHVKYCKECYTLTDQEICPVCSSTKRDHATIMVVENTRDLAAYEKTGKYTGVWGDFPHAGHRAKRYPPKRTDGKAGRRNQRGHCCYKFQPGRRNNSYVHWQTDKANRHKSHKNRQRRSGWGRLGIH